MSIMEILHFPDDRLRTQAKKVDQVTEKYKTLADDMLETMYAAPGIGLAATQVNVHEQMLVVDISDDKSQPLVIINPEILESRGIEIMEEGCLSVPDIYAEVERADWIKLKYQDLQGQEVEMEADGILAVCIQHEIDHLKGKLFVDYLSKLKRDRIRKKLEKLKKSKM